MKKISKRHRLIVVLVTVLVIGLFLSLHSIDNVYKQPLPPVSNAPALYAQEQVGTATPVRLEIPSISVDAAIESVGLTPDNAMGVPKGPADVAWFSLGPSPGQVGSAVIAGHYGWKDGIAAAFDNLSKLRKGDAIYVKDSRGQTVSFVVREMHLYDSQEYVPEIFTSAGGTHLNLITCIGTWDAAKQSYTKRLVVFADAAP